MIWYIVVMSIGKRNIYIVGGVYIGTTPVEGNLTISMKLLMHIFLTQKYTSGMLYKYTLKHVNL